MGARHPCKMQSHSRVTSGAPRPAEPCWRTRPWGAPAHARDGGGVFFFLGADKTRGQLIGGRAQKKKNLCHKSGGTRPKPRGRVPTRDLSNSLKSAPFPIDFCTFPHRQQGHRSQYTQSPPNRLQPTGWIQPTRIDSIRPADIVSRLSTHVSTRYVLKFVSCTASARLMCADTVFSMKICRSELRI